MGSDQTDYVKSLWIKSEFLSASQFKGGENGGEDRGVSLAVVYFWWMDGLESYIWWNGFAIFRSLDNKHMDFSNGGCSRDWPYSNRSRVQ